jgi:plastocyanin
MRNLIHVFVLSLAMVVVAAAAHATTHIIKFGGSLDDTYAPESMTIAVGDTIVWQGNFGKHPLTLETAPKGAAGFAHISSGDSYSYVVRVAGKYHYICDKHVDMGMEGDFTAK